MTVVKSSYPSVPKAAARISCMLDWHIELFGGLLVFWPPVQMEGRSSQCQLVSWIKTTHLFAEESHNATSPKHGEGECVGWARGRAAVRSGCVWHKWIRVLLVFWPLVPHTIPCSHFCVHLSFQSCQKLLPQCTEGSRQGSISTSAQVTDCRLSIGSGGGLKSGKSNWLLHMLWSGSGHWELVEERERRGHIFIVKVVEKDNKDSSLS